MKEQEIAIANYHFDLPFEKIAKFPLPERDQSKLLVYQDKQIKESNYFKLDDYLPKNSIVFFNNTKVIPARLFFKTTSGKSIEIFCLESAMNTQDVFGEMFQTKCVRWKCIVGGLAKWKDDFVFLSHDELQLKAQIIERLSDSLIIEFTWEPSDRTFSEVLQLAGNMPIPPYLKRDSEASDAIRYQTLYAKNEGSVAAPTAGLHFTDRVMQKLAAINCQPVYITLHVGAGTFKPVKSETMADHLMHREFLEVSLSAIELMIENVSNPITAVGTTSMRTIESLYWLGVKAFLNPKISKEELIVNQWDPYTLNKHDVSVKDALQSLKSYLLLNQLNSIYTQTSLLIVPGYQFKMIDVLITNFHQPQSTLILLVAAFIGEDWQKVYQYALENDYRFLSYGDGSLLFRTP